MAFRLVVLVAALALASCNTGESVFEWDEETQAIMDARAAEEEAREAGEDGESASAMAAEDGEALTLPLALLRDSGEMSLGELAVVPPTGESRKATASLATGDVCSGGLVATDGERGTFALSCESGTVWLGDYIFFAEDIGAAQMRDQSGAPARMVYGSDVSRLDVSTEDFENLWAVREAMAAQ